MSNIVGEIYLNVLPKDGGVTPGVQAIINKASESAVKIPVSAETEQAQQAVATLSGQIEDQVGGAWQAATAQAALFTATVLGVKAAIEGAVNKLSGLFDQLAQAQAGFSAILGSESAGGALLDEIREFARESPFVTQELVNYSQQLLGVGQSAESIVPLLRNTGDLIASVGGDTQNISRVLFTLTQIRSIGRLVGQDAMQLQSSLVPITKLLADFLGKTTAEVKKLQEQGAISADTVFAAINNAGQKVEGAMANATRNISGARSVLSDTVTIMLQDSQALNRVFDDIVEGILEFSDALGSNEQLQGTIDSIDESLVQLYDSLQPIFEGFSQTGAAVALNGLSVLASTLEILAGALEAVPQGALENIGRALAVLFALKAPFALLKYAESLRNIGTGLSADLAGRLRQTAAATTESGVAAEKAATGYDKFSVAQKRALTGVTALTFGVGLLTQSMFENNDAADAVSSALTTGALGAQLGAAGGPWGALIGGAAGAGVGLVTSFVSAAREESQRREAEMTEIGQKSAKAYIDAFKLTTPTITSGADFTSFLEGLKPDEEIIGQYDDLIAKQKELTDTYNAQSQALASSSPAFDTETFEAAAAGITQVKDELKDLEDASTAAKARLEEALTTGPFADAAGALSTVLTKLSMESEGYNALVNGQGGSFENAGDAAGAYAIAMGNAAQQSLLFGDQAINSSEDIELINETLGKVGLSIETALILPIEEVIAIMDGKLPSALTSARIALLETKTAFDEAKKAADEFYSPLLAQVNNAQAVIAAQKGLEKAANDLAAAQDPTQALAYGEALLNSSKLITTAADTIQQGTGAEAGIGFMTAQIDLLRDSLELTEPQFQDLLRNMGLLQFYNTESEDAFSGSISELGEQVGLTSDRIRELLPSLQDLKNDAGIVIPVNVLDALTQLGVFENGMGDAQTVAVTAAQAIEESLNTMDLFGNVLPQFDVLKSKIEEVTMAQALLQYGMASMGRGPKDQFDVEANAQRALIVEEREAIAEAARQEAERIRKEQERLAEEARREAERLAREAEAAAREAARIAEEAIREQQRLADALESASNTIQSSMENASQAIAQAADKWTSSIKERQQDEAAVPIARLLRNAGQQASNLDEINKGLVALEGRGLSKDAISALGIDNVTDIRQVRRLLGASNADLAELSRLIGLRDSNAEIIARREQQAETQATIVAAIIQAASILGYKITPEQARALSLQVNVTGDPSSAVLPTGIIDQLANAGLFLRG